MFKPKDAIFQVVIVGLLAFCGPGLFNALNGLGGAGSGSNATAAVGNGTLYAFFSVVGYFSGVFFNMLGPKPLFFFGGLSYAVYAICVYFTTPERVWLSAIGGTVLGAGAGLFWTAQGALMMAYSIENNRGLYIAIFWFIFNFGGVFGGLITFAINFSSSASGANPASYFTLIGLMTFGAIASVFVLTKPSSVVKADGTPVVFEKATSPKKEITAACKAITDPFIIKMLLFFFTSNWFYTYEFNGYNGHQFNVRTRGLNSSIFWFSQMVGSFITGKLLDNANQSIRKRARVGFFWNLLLLIFSFILAIVVQHTSCDGEWDKGHPCDLDFTESSRAAFPMITFFFMGMSDAVYQSFAYWLMSGAANNDIKRNVQYAACYKGVQSLGAAIAWLTDLSDGFTYKIQVYVCLVLCTIAILPSYTTTKYLIDPEVYTKNVTADSDEGFCPDAKI